MIIDAHTHVFPDAIAAKSIAFLEATGGQHARTDGTSSFATAIGISPDGIDYDEVYGK